jgi:hypothetical protein
VDDIPEVQERQLPVEEVISKKTEKEELDTLPKSSGIQVRFAQLLDYIQRGATIVNVDLAAPLFLDSAMAVALE